VAGAFRVRMMAPARLELLPGNPRRGDVAAVARSLAEFGQVKPVVVNERTGHVVAGNHTVMAARELGWDKIAVHVVDLDEAREQALAVADNRTSELGGIDEAALLEMLESIVATDADLLAAASYSAANLARMRPTAPPADPEPQMDRGDELAKKWGVETGQVWELGRHRVAVGDSRDAGTFDRLMDAPAAVLWTDPPYGVDYVGKTTAKLRIENDSAASLPALLRGAFGCVDEVLEPSARLYIASPPGPRGTDFRVAIAEAGWTFHQALVWVKDSMVLGHSDYHYRHEDVLYGWKPGAGRPGRGRHDGSRWYGDHSQTSVLEFARPKRSEEHPTMKPVELVEHCLGNSSQPGDVVLDCFLGSGTTLVACERMGRAGRGVEFDPGYAAVAIERLAAMGLKPTVAAEVAAA
jgi:DNA modification methylase